jgi:Ribulose-phosphate 3 epimerase family.
MNRDIWQEKCIFSPSLITLDLCNLESQVKQLEQSGIKVLHVDLLDGYFSPSMPIGLDVVRQLRKKTNLEFDVHIMVNSADYFIDELLDIGVQQIVFHAETEPHIDRRLNMIHDYGVRAGVALRPATSLTALDYVLEKCDTVLLMLINPGYAGHAGERQVPYAARKIRELRKMINDRGLDTKIEIDGRISAQDIKNYAGNDVDIFVTGSTCIDRADIPGSIRSLLALRESILA